MLSLCKESTRHVGMANLLGMGRRGVNISSAHRLSVASNTGRSSSSPSLLQLRPMFRGSLLLSNSRQYSTRTIEQQATLDTKERAKRQIWKTSIPLGAAAGLALLYWSTNAITLESDKNSKEEDKLDENFSQFARSVEEVEEEEKRLHRNAVMRVIYRTGRFLQDYIIEPLGTTKRFIVLVLLFGPVILTMPMLLVGRYREGGRRRGRKVAKVDGGTRWGAKWWYGFLVKQMERAGPTFIKVCTG